MLSIGLNPYGLAYTLGIQAANTPRVNPTPWSIDQYITFAESLNVHGIELHAPHLHGLTDDHLRQLRDRSAQNRWWTVLARPAWTGEWPRTFQVAKLLGTRVIRKAVVAARCSTPTSPARWARLPPALPLNRSTPLPEPYGADVLHLIECEHFCRR